MHQRQSADLGSQVVDQSARQASVVKKKSFSVRCSYLAYALNKPIPIILMVATCANVHEVKA
jgi:hypothetical protein